MLATLAQPKYTTPINGLALALALLWLALVGATLVPGQDDFGIYRRGALACLFKPINDIQPIIEAIKLAFDNSNRWWNTLRQLSDMKRQEPAYLTAGI